MPRHCAVGGSGCVAHASRRCCPSLLLFEVLGSHCRLRIAYAHGACATQG